MNRIRPKSHDAVELTHPNSDGTASFSTRTVFKTLDCPIRLATLMEPVLALSLVRNNSSSSISPALISSNSTIATVERNLYRIGPSSCARDGFWLPFHDLKQFSLLAASNNSTNLRYKGRRTYMITTICYYSKLIMRTFIFRL